MMSSKGITSHRLYPMYQIEAAKKELVPGVSLRRYSITTREAARVMYAKVKTISVVLMRKISNFSLSSKN